MVWTLIEVTIILTLRNAVVDSLVRCVAQLLYNKIMVMAM